jgi:hypothetical protein
MSATIKLYSYSYAELKTYLFAALFVVGNLVLPQLCHSIPMGGVIFLPIFFFTLIGAYKYGLGVGLLTAVLSPLLNSWLFGMPPVAILPTMVAQGVALAACAAWGARRSGRVSLWAILGAIAACQLLGAVVGIASGESFAAVLQTLRMGLPGMAIQLFGGYALLRAIARV